MNNSSRDAKSQHGWGFVLRTAISYLRRDWRAGELRVVALALVIAVSAVINVGIDTISQSVRRRLRVSVGDVTALPS